MRYLILVIICLSSFFAFSQPPPPGSGPGDPGGGGDPDEVPITGIEILLVSGGLLGAKKMYDNRKRSK